jgi:CBS domain containing-hemolysin-like protein
MIDLTAHPDDIRRTIVESTHSRLPVYAGTPEERLGVVQAKDLLDAYLRGDTCGRIGLCGPCPGRKDTRDISAS